MNALVYPNLRNGLVGAWCPSVDRSRSTLLIDQSGYGNHGTLTGGMDPATDWVASDGKVALDFDGSGDYVSTTLTTARLQFTCTVSIWMKPLKAAASTQREFLWGTGNVAVGTFDFQAFNDTNLYVGWFDLSPSVNYRVLVSKVSAGWTPDIWQNFTFRSGSFGSELYRNGLLVGSNATAPTGIPFTTETIQIGANTVAAAAPFWGQIDDVRIYNRALLQSEIATLAQRRGIAYETYRVPVVRGASVGGGHNLTANGISTGAPSLGTPALTQVHALTANGISAGTPSAGTPTITQTHSLAATAISTGAPSLGTPALSQAHVFTATGIATGAPSLGTPLLTIAGTLVADNITAGVPTLGSPAITQVHGLLANAIATGTPTLGQPGLTQVHGFTATGIATGAPTLGQPLLSTSDAMIVNGIVTGTPSLGSPSLSQVHVLVCMPIATSSPTLGQPSIAQTHSLIAMGIVTGVPTVGAPTLDGVSFLPEWASQANIGVGL